MTTLPPTTTTATLTDAAISRGIQFNLTDAISAITLIAPFLLAFLMVMISIINSNVKGFIYLLGLIILFAFVVLFQNTLKSPINATNNFCSVFNLTSYNVPSFNSALYLYTISYVLLPMVNMKMVNFPLIIIFIILYIMDCIVKYKNKCTTSVGIAAGSILGLIFGVTWYLVMKSTGNTGLLYYDDLVSNKIACTRPTKQNFKCKVYKNGELIQDI